MENREDIIEEVMEIPEEDSENVSNIKIAPEVVATIAGVATAEINGVAGMCSSFAGGIAEILGARKNVTKGIKVDMKENNTTVIDLYIIVDYGIRIPELAWEVQENVKNNVETMTGLTVEKVNIHIDGVSFKKSEQEEKERNEASVNDDADEIIVEETEIEEIPEEDEMQV